MGGFFSGAVKFLLVLFILAVVGYLGYLYGQSVLQSSLFEVSVPIKQNVFLDVNQTIEFPLKTEVGIPINKKIRIQKSIPISTTIPIDTIINVPVELPNGTIYVDIPINGVFPVSTTFYLDEEVVVSEDVIVPIDLIIDIPVNERFDIPIDSIVTAEIPIPEWMSQEYFQR